MKKITQQVFADYIGISRQKVSDLVKYKIIDLSQGIDKARLNYCEYLREVAAGRQSHGEFDLATERAALAHFQAEKIQLELEVLRENLIPAEDVEEAWGGAIVNIRQVLLTLPGRLANGLMDFNVNRNVIDDHAREIVYEALRELANNSATNQ